MPLRAAAAARFNMVEEIEKCYEKEEEEIGKNEKESQMAAGKRDRSRLDPQR
eukprot:m.183570 g.183570  ORF g.183570 m.183570 type:complete len:52 (-) comp10496_c0_seq8:2592-2747(-)